MIRRRHLSILATSALVAALAACQPEEGASDGASDRGTPPVIEVNAKDFEFEMPREVPSGWTTIRFTNSGEQEHFLYVYRLPDDVTFRRFKEEAMGPFGRVWNAYASGELEREEVAAELGERMPGWFFTDLTPVGGPALTEPGETSVATVDLEPGTYVVECYVKTPQGTYHTERGMQRELTVTSESNGAAPPEADARLTLSNYEISATGELAAGKHTVAVEVTENPDGFMMHDVNLVRLDGETSVEEVVGWMDWMNLDEFRAPAPGHALGGMEHMAAGRTGYVTVELEPGRYAWVSEGYGARGMVREFTVP